LALCLLAGPLAAQPLRLVREIDTEGAPGAPFPPSAGVVLQLGADGRAALGWANGGRSLPDATNVSFDGAGRVYAIDLQLGDLLLLRASERAVVSETRRIPELVRLDAAGIAVDGAGDRLFVLEPSRGRIVVIDGFLGAARRTVAEIPLPANPPPLRGLAYDPKSGRLYALAPATGELLELAADGTLLAVRQFPDEARAARAIAFAPSTDTTDDPGIQHLFAAAPNDSGGTTLELALDQLVLAAAPTVKATLLQTVLTSNFTPPSPDPSGIELLGPNGPLLISDGEVEETVNGITLYRGVNLWTVNLDGTVASTADTTFFSDEPTGVAVNPANGHLFFSDDTGTESVYEVTPGSDGKVSVGDTVRQIKVANYGPIDCEGVAFGDGSLWIAAGSEAEVYRISPGPNDVFDGGGDDVVSHFDTNAAGLTDAEGIAYDSDGGNVYVAGPAQDSLVAHFSPTGTLLRWIDISAASPKNPAGLAYGPGPAGSTSRRLYLVARGTDNNTDPNENDGKLFVFAVDPLGGGSTSSTTTTSTTTTSTTAPPTTTTTTATTAPSTTTTSTTSTTTTTTSTATTSTTTTTTQPLDSAPVAGLTVTPKKVRINQLVTADASASTDDKGIVSYRFAWGDGQVTTQAGAIATHSYATTGKKRVTLTVTDTAGQTGTKQGVVQVSP
jgi:sugar lactone lactonase YvrE